MQPHSPLHTPTSAEPSIDATATTMTSLPNDSAISVATIANASSSRPHSQSVFPASNDPAKRKSNSPRTHQPIIPYHELSPSEQAAQDLENNAAVQQAQDEIDIDSGADAHSIASAESGYESDTLGSSSTSLTSSVRDYAFENGRRYHRFREGAYNFPNDDSEQDREDMKHAMVVNLCQRLHFAPLGENPQHILDMGTGTGIWAIESKRCVRSAIGIRNARACFLGMDGRLIISFCGSGRFISGRKHLGRRSKSYTTGMGTPKRQVHGG